VHANLVGPSGPRRDAAEGEPAETLDDLVEAARLLGVLLVPLEYGHLHAVAAVVADAPLDVIAVAVQHAGGDGHVLLENLAVLEQGAQLAVCRLFLGDKDDAAGVAVETVDDARPVVAVGVA